MTRDLQQLADRGDLIPSERKPEDIGFLWSVARRDIATAEKGGEGLSDVHRLELAYNAALKFCLVLLAAEGFRPARGGGMLSRIAACLPGLLGDEHKHGVELLDTAGKTLMKRNEGSKVSAVAREELVAFTARLAEVTDEWMAANHPDIVKPESA